MGVLYALFFYALNLYSYYQKFVCASLILGDYGFNILQKQKKEQNDLQNLAFRLA